MKPPRHATQLETVSVTVPEDALEAYESALAVACGTVGFFLDEETGLWTLWTISQKSVDNVDTSAHHPGHGKRPQSGPPGTGLAGTVSGPPAVAP